MQGFGFTWGPEVRSGSAICVLALALAPQGERETERGGATPMSPSLARSSSRSRKTERWSGGGGRPWPLPFHLWLRLPPPAGAAPGPASRWIPARAVRPPQPPTLPNATPPSLAGVLKSYSLATQRVGGSAPSAADGPGAATAGLAPLAGGPDLTRMRGPRAALDNGPSINGSAQERRASASSARSSS